MDLTAESEVPGLTKGRVEALSDGIFATVMTVLVLGLSIPVFSTDVLGQVEGLAPTIASYVLSYLILTVMWISHHNIFHYVTRLNRPLTWLNALFLLSIGFIPFSTTLLGKYPFVWATAVIYGLNIAGVSLAFQAFLYYSIRSKLLVAEGAHATFIRTIQLRWRIGSIVYGTGVVLSFFSPIISVGIYVAAALLFVLSSSLTIRLRHAANVLI